MVEFGIWANFEAKIDWVCLIMNFHRFHVTKFQSEQFLTCQSLKFLEILDFLEKKIENSAFFGQKTEKIWVCNHSKFSIFHNHALEMLKKFKNCILKPEMSEFSRFPMPQKL